MRTNHPAPPRGSKGLASAPSLCWLLGLVCFLSACTAKHYRRSADKEVYGIIQQVEQQVFGHTNAFTIDTKYSNRKPEDIKPPELIEDRLATNARVLTIEEALDLAVHSSRKYQSSKETLYLSALSLTGNRYAFDPQFFGTLTPTFARSSTDQQSFLVKGKVGVSQLLKTGGRFGVSLANDILRYYTGDPTRSVISVVSVDIAQPLLRGFGPNNDAVENLTQAERNVVYAIRNYSYFQDQFALDVVNNYFDLLAQKDIIRNRYTNYLGRVQSTKRLEARSHDRERLSDVDQARQAELTARNNYVNSVAAYQNSLDQFKIKLGLTLGDRIRLPDDALSEMEQNGLVPAQVDPDEAFRVAVDKQLQVLNAIDKFEDSKRKIRVYADKLRPGVNLVGNASLDSTRPTDYTRFDARNTSASIGLNLDLPFDRLDERNNYRESLITFESQIRELTLTLDNLKDSIQRGLRTLQQRRENYDIQKSALELANRRVTSTTLLLEAGRAEVRDLVDAQDAQISAQNAVTAALVEYQQTRLQLLLDIGALDTEVPKFWLKDHLAGFIPPKGPVQSAATPGSDTVLPPEQFFNN